MKQIKKNYVSAHSGYIMIFTLLIIAAAMTVVTYVGHRGSFYVPFSSMSLAREKAKEIALGGIQVGMAQLAKTVKPEENKENKKDASDKQESNTPEKDFLKRILPVLNRWQHFDLKEEIDGIDAQISICIMCEDGKINLNRIIDFEKGAFRGDDKSGWKAIMQEICKLINQTHKGTDLFVAFEKIIKEMKYPFNDATELITHKEFQQFNDTLFYRPPTSDKQTSLYLTDIFTIWSRSDKLEPWLFSDSINGLFGLPRVEVDDIKKRKDQIEAWIKNFKIRANWQQDWQTLLMPVYGKELRTLPKNIDSVLKPTFAPQYFSILVDGKVDDVTQRVYAIVERTKHSQGNTVEYDIKIIKLYWL